MIMFMVVAMFMTVIVMMVVLVHYDLRWEMFVHLMGMVMVVFVDWHHNFNVYTIYKLCFKTCLIWFELDLLFALMTVWLQETTHEEEH